MVRLRELTTAALRRFYAVHRIRFTEKPVWVKLTGSVVDGQKLEVRDSGNVIRFSGGVRMVVQPDQMNAQTSER